MGCGTIKEQPKELARQQAKKQSHQQHLKSSGQENKGGKDKVGRQQKGVEQEQRQQQLIRSAGPSWQQDNQKFLKLPQQNKHLDQSPIDIVYSSDYPQQGSKIFKMSPLPLQSRVIDNTHRKDSNNKYLINTIQERSNQDSKMGSLAMIDSRQIKAEVRESKSDIFNPNLPSNELPRKQIHSHKVEKYAGKSDSIIVEEEEVECQEEEFRAIEFKMKMVRLVPSAA